MSEAETIHVTYYGVVKFGERGLIAQFPDFPECVVHVRSFDEIDHKGREAVNREAARLLKRGKPLPRPTSLEELQDIRENRNTFLIKFEIEIPESLPLRWASG